ncbi:MAG TPA: amylo-alpha-1,6-glucosidase [Actinomycetota bacterium]
MTAEIRFGRQVCGNLAEASAREWLVADGLGGYAMGTVGGLRTRRYHGLLMVATEPPRGRMLALASLDPVLVLGDNRVRLAVHEWAGTAVAPQGHLALESFALRDGVPTWRWQIGDVVLEREVAMAHGRPAVGVVMRVIRAPGPVRVELEALGTWRDAHTERFGNWEPEVDQLDDGYVFEGRYRVRGPGFDPAGAAWYRGVSHREEAGRGLTDREDLFFGGRFGRDLGAGETLEVVAWAGPDLTDGSAPLPAAVLVQGARDRAADVAARAEPRDEADRHLAIAADQFVVAGPAVVAGYPWFADWSRDTMTSYEGLFLETGRADEGRVLLEGHATSLSEGMLANTADAGGTGYNTADATLWFVHAVGRHVDWTGDLDLAAAMADPFGDIVRHHVEGTRYGIRAGDDGLLSQGADGVALTWMDARVDGRPVTPRAGKPVEVNALWVNALATIADLGERRGDDAGEVRTLEATARQSFRSRFVHDGGLFDVVDGPGGDDAAMRPNQILAVSLPFAPIPDGAQVVRACERTLLTSLGLRSMGQDEPGYRGWHRGGPAERDEAYHSGTVWPWLIGPFVEAALKTGVSVDGALDGLEAHVAEWGLGSVSETADGDAPHAATGCPFQAWSVAELLRARRMVSRAAAGGVPTPEPA